jgi:protoporphyrinogen oxidase
VTDEVKQAADKLKFRNTVLVYLRLEGVNLFPDNWLYIQEPDVQVGRITNFRNWVPELYGSSKDTVLALEYWCYNEDKLWNISDQVLIELARKELEQTGLLKHAKVLAGHVYKIPRCYPVYHKGYKENLAPIIDYLQNISNLFCIGRYGSFKYNNQDHSILMGMLVAENIVANAGHNLWNINTDYDNYQEESLITETGLKESF